MGNTATDEKYGNEAAPFFMQAIETFYKFLFRSDTEWGFFSCLKKSTKTVEIVSAFRQLINFFSPSDYFTIYTD